MIREFVCCVVKENGIFLDGIVGFDGIIRSNDSISSQTGEGGRGTL